MGELERAVDWMFAALLRLDVDFYKAMGDFVRQYQTLLVGGLGFAGVIATLSMNAWLGRRQHDRQVQHEARVLRTALLAELEAVAESYRERIALLEDPGGGMHFPLATMTAVYKSLVGKIGLLPRTEIRLVLRAYLLALQLPDTVMFLADQTVPSEPGFVFVPGHSAAKLRQLHMNYLEEIDRAVSALSASAGMALR